MTAAFLFILSAGRSAAALRPETRFTQYSHRVWRLGDAGLLGTPQGIAQSADGYIWVSTSDGLFRFDGVQFTRSPDGEHALPSNSLWHLFGARNDSLYVGTDLGLARISGHSVYTYPMSPRWPGPFLEDASGTIWMGVNGAQSNPDAICKAGAVSISCLGENDGFRCGRGLSNALDREGRILIGGSAGVCRWQPGSAPEVLLPPPRGRSRMPVRAIACDRERTIWAGGTTPKDGPGLMRSVKGVWSAFVADGLDGRTVSVSTLLAGREGVLWVGTDDRGLLKLRNGSVDRFDTANGLSGRRVVALFEDREGNLWVATPDGIDYFRDYAVLSFTPVRSEKRDQAREVASDTQGNVYLGSGTLTRLRGEESTELTDERGRLLRAIQFLFADSRDRLWIADGGRILVRQKDGTVEAVGNLPQPDDYVDSIAEDRNHDIWFAVQGASAREASLLVVRGSRVNGRYSAGAEIGGQAMNALASDPAGGLWIGGSAHGLFHFREGRFERVRADLFDDRVENILVEPTGAMWLVTPHGFVRYADARTKLLAAAAGLPCDGGVNIHSDGTGSKWLYMHCGIVRVSDEELSQWWAGTRKRVGGRVFGPLDGAHPNLFNGSPAQTPSGLLWSANGYEFQLIDLNRLPFNSLAPPVFVESIAADGQMFGPAAEIRLLARTRQIDVKYTGLSFSIPEKVRFRYRLRGHDSRWMNAGTRREAFYTDLAPGHYVFEVVASNNDGVWNPRAASLAFYVPPAWYQMMAFRVLAGVGFIALLTMAYFFRLESYARSLRLRFDERLDERTRLARDLHDTLLQTIHGSRMVADAARDHVDDPQATRSALDRLACWLERASREGRAALDALRMSTAETRDLVAAFRRAASDCQTDHAMKILVSTRGTRAALHPIARDEAYRIGYEAIRNACRHSGLTELRVEVEYKRNLSLKIRDNGCGFDTALVVSGKPGHFGLAGMRERASRVGGYLEITSSAASGTLVALTVPGKVIYQDSPGTRFSGLMRLFRRGRRPDLE